MSFVNVLTRKRVNWSNEKKDIISCECIIEFQHEKTYVSGVIGVHNELSLPLLTLLPPQVIEIKVKQVSAPELIVFPLKVGRQWPFS